MPRPYSPDSREQVIEAIVAGASRREAAEQYGLSPSVVVVWMWRWEATGSTAARPSGGSVSPLEDHADFLLDLVAEQPDLTLDEIVAAMVKAGIVGSRTSAVIDAVAAGNREGWRDMSVSGIMAASAR